MSARQAGLLVVVAVLLLPCYEGKPRCKPVHTNFREFDSNRFLKTRELSDHCEGQCICDDTAAVVPPGSARVFELMSTAPSRFEVALSAYPALLWPQGNPPHELPITQWPTEAQCGGNGIIAVAFRGHNVPHGLLRPKSDGARGLLGEVTEGMATPPGGMANSSLSAFYKRVFEAARQEVPGKERKLPVGSCGDFWVPGQPVLKLTTDPTHNQSVLKWSQSQFSDHLTGSDANCKSYECYKQNVVQGTQLPSKGMSRSAWSAIIPSGTEGPRKECGICGSQQYVYVYNCYKAPHAHMWVRVRLQQLPYDRACYTKRDQTAIVMLVISLLCMILCAGAFSGPMFVLTCLAELLKLCKLEDSRLCKRVSNLVNPRSEGPAQGCQDDERSGNPWSGTLTERTRSRRLRESWRMYIDMLTTMHNPSGYSRLYTVALVTTAALVIAGIVWPPTVNPTAQHDHAYFDSIITPRQSTYQQNKAHVITYYLKIMGLSALIGHTVKLALLANLSPPDTAKAEREIRVPEEVWRAQRAVSTFGLCVVVVLMLSTLFYLVLQWRVWTEKWAYWWLMLCIIANFVVAVVSFVVCMFVKRPPLLVKPNQNKPCQTGHNVAQNPDTQGVPCAGQAPHAAVSNPPVPAGGVYPPPCFYSTPPAPTPTDTTQGPHSHCGVPLESSDNMASAAAKKSPFQTAVESHDAHVCTRPVTDQGASPALADNQAHRVGQPGEPDGTVQASGETSCCIRTRAAFATAWSWLKGLPAWFREAVWEEPTFKYSSWVLTPVWLTCYLIIFWWLMGVENSGSWLDCVSDPHCIGAGLLQYSGTAVQPFPVNGKDRLTMLKQVLNLSGQQAILQLNGSRPGNITDQERLSGIVYAITTLTNDYNFGTLSSPELSKAVQQAADSYDMFHHNLDNARKIGRWVGYSLATAFAVMSLFRIVMSFKHGIKEAAHWDKFWRENEDLQKGIAKAIGQAVPQDTTQARKVASLVAAATPQTADDRAKVIEWAVAIFGQNPVANNQVQLLSCTATSKDPALDPTRSGPSSRPVPVLSATAGQLAASRSSTALAESIPQTMSEGLSTRLMQQLQQQQTDMEKAHIGASVALFGVLASTMWIQIRFVGFVLSLGLTLAAHPLVWRIANEHGWLLAIACLVILVLVNIALVKIYIGSKILSDGRYIKHPGSWMTFVLMFQLCFMVLGWLYSLWRILLALLIMLLYSVAALDRSLLHTAQFLDGPYKTFLASVKLEGAYHRISQGRRYGDDNNDETADAGQDQANSASSARQQHLEMSQRQQELRFRQPYCLETEGSDGHVHVVVRPE